MTLPASFIDAVSADDVGRIIKALAFAAHKHRDQRRKDVNASPYINHPIALAHVLYHEGGVTNARVIAAALLHDTIEDTETTAAEIEHEFGGEICEIVLQVTDDTSLSRADRKQRQVERSADASNDAKLVKLADKICNLRDMLSNPPASWSLARRREYFDWAKAVVDRIRGINPRLEALFDEVYAKRP
ncbi:MAG: HD domain-containing protein [Acidiferrobacterales bacterium]